MIISKILFKEEIFSLYLILWKISNTHNSEENSIIALLCTQQPVPIIISILTTLFHLFFFLPVAFFF